jgi:hypothetical protein
MASIQKDAEGCRLKYLKTAEPDFYVIMFISISHQAEINHRIGQHRYLLFRS